MRLPTEFVLVYKTWCSLELSLLPFIPCNPNEHHRNTVKKPKSMRKRVTRGSSIKRKDFQKNVNAYNKYARYNQRVHLQKAHCDDVEDLTRSHIQSKINKPSTSRGGKVYIASKFPHTLFWKPWRKQAVQRKNSVPHNMKLVEETSENTTKQNGTLEIVS